MATNIGSILAQSGSTTGQLMGGGIARVGAGLGAGIGGMLTRRQESERIREQAAKQQQMAGLVASGQQMEDQATALAEKRRRGLLTKQAIQLAQKDGDTASLQAIGVGALDPAEYLKSRANSGGVKPVTLPAGAALVDQTTGKIIAERGFKPEKPEKPDNKGIKVVEREDGSVSILNANDGSLISTLDATENGQVDRDAALNLIAKTTGYIQDVDELMGPGFTETGFIGGVTSMVPGTPAYDRDKELLSIRARLGFEQINEMKRLAAESGASGTGLGQISNIEFMSLQSNVEAIYTGMGAKAQDKALLGIKKHLLNVQKLASGIAPADAIDWSAPEYKAVGYHQDPETGIVFYAPDGPNGTRYKLVDGKFVKLGV